MSNPKEKQINGSHYKQMAIQPSEFIVKNNIAWYEGNAIKYLCRHAKKGGKVDLQKAMHYIELAMQEYYGGYEKNKRSSKMEREKQVEVVNVCIVNALRIDEEHRMMIIEKLTQNLTDENRTKLLRLLGVVGQSEHLKAVQKLKDFAYEVCPLHREDDLEEIVGSL